MLSFNINQKQYDILLGLRHFMADKAYLRERGGDQADIEKDHKTIIGLFDEADKAGIPFWVQNIVCSFQDDWRHTLDTYLYTDLEKRNVNCSLVSCR